jgi:hypothetical protein
MWQAKPLNGSDLSLSAAVLTDAFFPANYLTKNVPVKSQYRNLFGCAGWRTIIVLWRLRNQSVCDFGAAASHAASVMCQNLPVNMMILTRNPKVE